MLKKTIHFFIRSAFIWAFLSIGMYGYAAHSFEKSISGTIKDENNDPLIGVSIVAKNSSTGTVTDADGHYQLSLPDDVTTLVFSYIGYQTQEINIDGRNIIDVVMISAASQIEQVVVIGYGTINKRDVTGAVKSLRTEEFNKGIINTPEQLLQGKVAGVNVTTASGDPNAAISVTVRGPGGVRTGSDPLYVIDGLAINGPASFLNPEDIESIDVLKDASATAICRAESGLG